MARPRSFAAATSAAECRAKIELNQTQVAEALAEPVNQIVEVVRTALEHTQPEIAADVIDQGITMTGGGSLLREFEPSFRTRRAFRCMWPTIR